MEQKISEVKKVKTDQEEIDPNTLLDVEDFARIFKVKPSWVYARTRRIDCGGLPVIWVGRYPRFKYGEIWAHFRNQPHPRMKQ